LAIEVGAGHRDALLPQPINVKTDRVADIRLDGGNVLAGRHVAAQVRHIGGQISIRLPDDDRVAISVLAPLGTRRSARSSNQPIANALPTTRAATKNGQISAKVSKLIRAIS
jgi:hypothetical protein